MAKFHSRRVVKRKEEDGGEEQLLLSQLEMLSYWNL